MNTINRVAVYGTLRSDQSNNGLLAAARSLGTTTINGYSMYCMGGIANIPFVVPAEVVMDIDPDMRTPTDTVVVEVFELPDDENLGGRIRSLDYLEGHPDWYTRTEIQVDGKPTWIYLFLKDTAADYLQNWRTFIHPTGDWVEGRKNAA